MRPAPSWIATSAAGGLLSLAVGCASPAASSESGLAEVQTCIRLSADATNAEEVLVGRLSGACTSLPVFTVEEVDVGDAGADSSRAFLVTQVAGSTARELASQASRQAAAHGGRLPAVGQGAGGAGRALLASRAVLAGNVGLFVLMPSALGVEDIPARPTWLGTPLDDEAVRTKGTTAVLAALRRHLSRGWISIDVLPDALLDALESSSEGPRRDWDLGHRFGRPVFLHESGHAFVLGADEELGGTAVANGCGYVPGLWSPHAACGKDAATWGMTDRDLRGLEGKYVFPGSVRVPIECGPSRMSLVVQLEGYENYGADALRTMGKPANDVWVARGAEESREPSARTTVTERLLSHLRQLFQLPADGELAAELGFARLVASRCRSRIEVAIDPRSPLYGKPLPPTPALPNGCTVAIGTEPDVSWHDATKVEACK